MNKESVSAFNAAVSGSTMTINRWDDKIWRNDQGKLHRLDEPAIERKSGTKEWWVDNRRHRLDGPAVEYPDGSKSWWIDNKRLNAEEIKLRRRQLEEAAHKKRIAHLDRLMGARRKRQP